MQISIYSFVTVCPSVCLFVPGGTDRQLEWRTITEEGRKEEGETDADEEEFMKRRDGRGRRASEVDFGNESRSVLPSSAAHAR